jgi:hypothetical protein
MKQVSYWNDLWTAGGGLGFDSCQGQRDSSVMPCSPPSVLPCIIILYTGIKQPEIEADRAHVPNAVPQLPNVM